jgi:hypothetical protein
MEEGIYSRERVWEYCEDDAISPAEEGFMIGYIESL